MPQSHGALGVATDCPGAPGRGAVEKRGEFATEFDRVHSVERAVRTGSVSTMITPSALRPFLVEAVERGMRRTLER